MNTHEWKHRLGIGGCDNWWLVNTATERLECRLDNYDQNGWQVFYRGADEGKYETLETAKRHAETVAHAVAAGSPHHS